MTDQFKHAAHLLIATLVQHHFVPCVGLRFVELGDLRGCRASSVFEPDSTSQSFDRIVRRDAFYFNFVNLIDAVTRRGNEVCELAVVSE